MNKLIIILLLSINCKEEIEISYNKIRPNNVPKEAIQLDNGEWIIRDFESGYYGLWQHDGFDIVEIFLINNLTEKVVIDYPGPGALKYFNKYKLINNKYIPKDSDDLRSLEDPELRKMRLLTNIRKIYLNQKTNDYFYPREFFGMMMWNSGTRFAFRKNELMNRECYEIVNLKPSIEIDNCNSKYIYENNSIKAIQNFKLICKHSCSDEIIILRKGIYKLKKKEITLVYREINNESSRFETIDSKDEFEILHNPIKILDINYTNFNWRKIKHRNNIGYIPKAKINNIPIQ